MGYDSKSYIQSLSKGLSVLDTYRSDQDEYGISELSEMNSIPESSVQRVVNTLEFKGFLIQNPKNRKYRLSLRLLLFNQTTNNMKLWLDKTKIYMSDLNKKSGETVNLAIRCENTLVYLDKVDSKHMLRPNFIIGNRYPLYSTGLGKCLISDLTEDIIESLFPDTLNKLTPNTKTTLSELKEDLYNIREKGYCFDDEEFNLGLTCVASPIYAWDRKVVAAISITLPKIRLTQGIYEHLVLWVRDAAAKVSIDYKDLLNASVKIADKSDYML